MALRASIAGVISTVNRKECLKQPRAHYEAKMDEYKAMIAEYGTKVQAIDAEITTIKAGEVHEVLDTGSYSRSRQQQTTSLLTGNLLLPGTTNTLNWGIQFITHNNNILSLTCYSCRRSTFPTS